MWSRDGRELFYRSADQMLVVAVETTQSFEAAAPELLFRATGALNPVGVPDYDVAPDGRRFLMVKTEGEPEKDTAEITVVLNWHQELLERVPIP